MSKTRQPKPRLAIVEETERLAKRLVLNCVRNSRLEELHAGTFPSSKTGDYSDVKVVSPYGEIPWTELGRISDAEMRLLLIDIVNQLFTVLLHGLAMNLPLPERWDPAVDLLAHVPIDRPSPEERIAWIHRWLGRMGAEIDNHGRIVLRDGRCHESGPDGRVAHALDCKSSYSGSNPLPASRRGSR